MAISLDAQIYAFAELGKLEQRVLEVEGLVGALKRRCLTTHSGSLPELVSATAEMRWQLSQIMTHVLGVDAGGCARGR